jgi:hypothetical protein
MSAPHTTGVAALAADEFPGLIERPTVLKRLVMATGQPAPLTRGKTVTGDIVNADGAVTDTPPRITGFSPTGVVSDTTPTIRATVVDLQGLLEKPDLEVSVDNGRNFSYNADSGALSLPGGRMEEGHPSVQITAADPSDPQAPRKPQRPRKGGPSGCSERGGQPREEGPGTDRTPLYCSESL